MGLCEGCELTKQASEDAQWCRVSGPVQEEHQVMPGGQVLLLEAKDLLHLGFRRRLILLRGCILLWSLLLSISAYQSSWTVQQYNKLQHKKQHPATLMCKITKPQLQFGEVWGQTTRIKIRLTCRRVSGLHGAIKVLVWGARLKEPLSSLTQVEVEISGLVVSKGQCYVSVARCVHSSTGVHMGGGGAALGMLEKDARRWLAGSTPDHAH